MAARGRNAALLAVLLLNVLGLGSALTFDANAAKARPVSKVISLLKDMLQQLEKEAAEDQEIYDKLACWCETNEKEKTKSIAEANARIAALGTQIEELTASSARLSTEISHLEKEVVENQESLDQATALRQKQLAAFNGEEKDMLGSISALKAAVTVLSKHHGSSLLQVDIPSTHMLGVAAALQHQMEKHADLLSGVLSHKERRAILAFIQSPFQSYAPQSGEIFGILKTMQETFESNLSAAQKEELANQQAYEDLKAAKVTEIEAGKEQIDSKTQELADTDEKNARSKEDLLGTKKSLAADEEFLANLREKCAVTDKEWEERQNTRHLESEAVSKALAILSADDAKDLFSRNFNPSLLQRRSASHSQRRAKASAVLAEAAQKSQDQQLAVLAARVKLDAFERVKQAISDMVAQLLKEKEDEIKHKDFCVAEFNTNQEQTEDAHREKDSLTAQIEDLEEAIKALDASLKSLKAEVAEMQFQMKRASEVREKENLAFQASLSDQRETQKLLKAALESLQGFYGKKAALVQAKQPAGFKEYKNNASSSGVLDLLQQIITDSKASEAEIIRSEEDAQKAYEDFVKESNTSIEAKSREIVNKSEIKAKTEADLVATKESKEAVELTLEQLSAFNLQLHQSCDFVMKNFDLRQEARDEEVEALRQATAILSGANFAALQEQ